jgi:Ni,Fe-hydrogenase III component G
MMDARWGYLMAITGIDHPAVEGQTEGVLEAVYFFANEAAIAGLRVAVPYSQAKLPSICDIAPSATLYERELMELFGFDVENTPVRDHLVLPDDWPDGVYPMRKSFTGLADIKGA